jgi:class 3 adenylate cyclase
MLPGSPAALAESSRVSAAIDAFNRRWEIGMHRIMAVLILAAAVMIVAISPWIGLELAIPELILCCIAVGYFAASSVIVRSMEGKWLEHVRWISATAEASFGTLAIAIASQIKGAEWAATSPMMLIYAVAIVACAIRIRPRLTAYATAVGCVQWVVLYYVLLYPALDTHTAAETSLPWACWERCFWLALIGGCATFATMQVRRTAVAGGSQAVRRAWVMQELSKFLSTEATQVALDGRAHRGFVDRREVTVLFCDLRDFTGLCERERPEDVMALLNDFYADACHVIRENDGQVNKFLGDGLLALFDGRMTVQSHPMAAVTAAEALADVAGRLRKREGIWQQLSIGIGIDTGPVVIGTVGAEERLELTAIGTTVNRAARLQAEANRTPRRIVLSEACVDALDGEIEVSALGAVEIKGFDAPAKIFAPSGNDDSKSG